MDPVKRKVISELFFAPSVVLPIVAGISAGLLSWAGGGVNYLSAAAVLGVLGGLGWMATRIIFKVEEITEAAMKLYESQRKQATEAELDELANQLRTDGDPRTRDYLTLLRSLREDFIKTSSQPGVQGRSSQLRDRVEEVFSATIHQLRESIAMMTLIRKLEGPARRKIQAERELLVGDIIHTVDQLRTTVSDFENVIRADKRADLTTLREELETSLEVAKRTEQRLRELDASGSADERYEADKSDLQDRPR